MGLERDGMTIRPLATADRRRWFLLRPRLPGVAGIERNHMTTCPHCGMNLYGIRIISSPPPFQFQYDEDDAMELYPYDGVPADTRENWDGREGVSE